jgi:integrase
MVKPPRLDHVKWTRSKGRLYPYFNTGKKHPNGQPVRTRLPDYTHPSFWPKYASLKAARDKRTERAYTVASACDGYEASKHYRDKADGTRRLYSYVLRIIRDGLGYFPINELKRRHVQGLLDKGLPSPSLHNPALAVLGLVYRHAREQGKTELFPTRDFDKAKGGSHHAWPESLIEAGLRSEHDRTRLAVHLLFFTGQRIGDVCKMRWSDVRDDEIYVVQQKTGKKLWVPFHSELRAELDRTPKRGLTIITNHEGHPMTPQVIRRELKALGKLYGVAVVPHGLRKNAVISLLEAGCSVAETAAITGQTYRVVEQYAAEISQRRMGKAAILKLEQRRNGETGRKTGG